MRVITKSDFEQYASSDPLLKMVKDSEDSPDRAIQTHLWLLDSQPKRMTYWELYRDLLEGQLSNMRVLDVGGGYTALTKVLARRHEYFLIDILAHGGGDCVKKIEQALGRSICFVGDWAEYKFSKTFDIVIAHDLFPNVDQRIDLFFEKVLPLCRELRISLTYYPSPRFYKVKRMDADEVFFIKAWDDRQTAGALEAYGSRIAEYDRQILSRYSQSIFPNGRQVALVTLRGDLG